MDKRVHLGSVNGATGQIWFTLVIPDSLDYYVERYDDSPFPLVKDRFVKIEPDDFGKYEINGIPLRKFIGEKMKDIIPENHPLRFKLRPSIRDFSPGEQV